MLKDCCGQHVSMIPSLVRQPPSISKLQNSLKNKTNSKLWKQHQPLACTHAYIHKHVHTPHLPPHTHTENVKLERRFFEWLSHIITFSLFFCAWRLVQVLPGHRSICDQWFTHLPGWLTWDTWDITLDMKNPKKKNNKKMSKLTGQQFCICVYVCLHMCV